MIAALLVAAVCPFVPNATFGFYQWASTAPSDVLERTQEALHRLHAGLVRIYLGPRYDYHSAVLAEGRQRLGPDEAWRQPHIRRLLDDPCISTVVLTAYPARNYGSGPDDINLNRPWSKLDEAAEYAQMFALADGLYREYGQQARTFILANSEADARLLEIANYTGSLQDALKNIIAWQRTRYRAVADARLKHAGARLRVLNAFEISLVNLEIVRDGGGFRHDTDGTVNALTSIVPQVPFDILSYSAYESINSPFETGAIDTPPAAITQRLVRDWRRLRRATAKPIMIGELGFSRREFDALPTGGVTPRLDAALSALRRIRPAYTVLWQAFDGVRADGSSDGFGLLEAEGSAEAVIRKYLGQ